MDISRRSFLRGSIAAAALPLVPGCLPGTGSPDHPSGPSAGDGIDMLYGHGPDAIRLNKNENPFGPSPRAIEAVSRHLDQSHRYVDSTALRETLAARHGLEPDMVITGTGSGEILRMIPFAWMLDGGNIVSARQTYRATPSVVERMGGEVRWVDMRDDGGWDVDAMIAAADAGTRIFYVVNPSNPTGATLEREDLEKMLGAVSGTALFLVDEAYVHFLPDRGWSALDLLGEHRNVFVTRTFSKAYGLAGLRVGWGAGHPEVVERIDRFMMTGMNTAAFAGALAALDDAEHVERFVAHARECKAFYEERLSELGLNPICGHAPLVMAEIGDDVPRVVEALAASGIHVRDGSSWEMPRHIRISFGLAHQNERVVESLREALAA